MGGGVSGVSRVSPSAADWQSQWLALCVEQEFLIPFYAGDGGWNGFDYLPAERSHAIGYFVNGQLMSFRIAHDAAFADVLAAGFELRLDQDDGFQERRRSGKDCRQ